MKKAEYFSLTNRLCIAFSALFAGLLILSCAQDPIFHNISLEERPRDSIIAGSGGNMIFVPDPPTGGHIYAWTHRGRDVWRFDSTGRWHRMTRPGGPVTGVAAIGTTIFAVTHTSGRIPRSQIKRYTPGPTLGTGNWEIIRSVPYVILSLYSAGTGTNGRLFAGGQCINNLERYYILRFSNPSILPSDPGTPLQLDEIVSTGTIYNVLTGVAQNGGTFIATGRNGIIRLDTPDASITDTTITNNTIGRFDIDQTTGIYSIGNGIVVVGRRANRGIARVIRTDTPPGNYDFDINFSATLRENEFFSGGMGVWREYNDSSGWQNSLLLLGVWSLRRNINGYREIRLASGDIPVGNDISPSIPGGHQSPNASSMRNRAIYTASIGTRAVQAIMQVPHSMLPTGSPQTGWQPPIFASTSRDGLWVYHPDRDRWNAEDNRYNWLP